MQPWYGIPCPTPPTIHPLQAADVSLTLDLPYPPTYVIKGSTAATYWKVAQTGRRANNSISTALEGVYVYTTFNMFTIFFNFGLTVYTRPPIILKNPTN